MQLIETLRRKLGSRNGRASAARGDSAKWEGDGHGCGVVRGATRRHHERAWGDAADPLVCPLHTACGCWQAAIQWMALRVRSTLKVRRVLRIPCDCFTDQERIFAWRHSLPPIDTAAPSTARHPAEREGPARALLPRPARPAQRSHARSARLGPPCVTRALRSTSCRSRPPVAPTPRATRCATKSFCRIARTPP